jgi:cell wall-associated NlpC family hydrolase
MQKRNFLISLAVLASGLAGCSSTPPRVETVGRAASPAGNAPPPAADPPAADALERLLAADRDPRRTEVVMAALSQVGTPYAWGGRSPITGFDCSGLVSYVYHRTCRLVLPRVSNEQARHGTPVDESTLRPADLVFFNTLGQPFSHVGIFIGQERFVHAPFTGSQVQVARINSPWWRNRFSGARRVIV